MSCENKYVFYKNFPVIRLNNSCQNFPYKIDCDRCDIYKESYISSGGYNSTFVITTKKCQNNSCKDIQNHSGVLRISHKYLDNEEIENEKLGLYLQSLFSTSISKGGFGCKYICKVYDFGDYTLENNRLAKDMFECGLNDKKNCKSITFSEEGEFSEGVYGILENISGGDLFDRLLTKVNNNSKFREEDIGNMIGQLLIALNCMHTKGYVHLDIKPENILLKDKKKDDNIKLIDFGFVNMIPESGYINPSDFGRAGTPTYKAPEINFDNKCNDKADIWSVGITAIVLLLQRTNYDDVSIEPGEFKETLIPEKFFSKYRNELSKYSKDCFDFLQKTLVWDFNNRISSSECLRHPWIQKNCKESLKYSKSSINLHTTQKNQKNTLKKTSKKNSSNIVNSLEEYLKTWISKLNKIR